MVQRLSVLLAPALLCVGCASPDNTISVERTPTPGEPTDTPDAPTAEQVAIIRVSPDTLDFGTQGVGCRIERGIDVHNDGGAILNVYSVSLSIASSTDFTIDSDTLLQVPPQSSAVLPVVYEVSGQGADTGTLLIQSNDQEAGTLTVSLKGLASESVSVQESFEQTAGGPVDVLFALDVTSYATDYTAGFAINFDLLNASLGGSGLDWHMGWMSLDPVDGAELSGTFTESGRPYLATGDDEATIDAFQTGIGQRLALPSSAQTPGFALILNALSEEKLAGAHAGFLRDDAKLIVYIVTVYDDDSQTPARLPVDVDDVIEQLQAVKSDPSLVVVDGILGEYSGTCAREEGYRYKELVQATGGYTKDVCFNLWSDAMATLAAQMQELEDTFVLSATPDAAAPLTVTVDGEAVAKDNKTGWSFDPNLNAVIFHGTSVPLAGQTVTVSFDRGGACSE